MCLIDHGKPKDYYEKYIWLIIKLLSIAIP